MAKFSTIFCCFVVCCIDGLFAIPILEISKCQSCPEKRPECEPDQVLVEVVRGTGEPGSCCSRYQCVSEMPVCDRSNPVRFYPNACIECKTCSICLSICPSSESEQLLNCLTFNEEPKMKGDIWMENNGCTTCECDQQSERSCKATQCLEPDCENPIQREGDCCPVCPSKDDEELIRPSIAGTTSGPPLVLNRTTTSTTEKIEDRTAEMVDPTNEYEYSSTATTTTSSLSSTENEPSDVPLASSTPIDSSTESDNATTMESSPASEGPVAPPDFDEYSTLDASSTKPTTDLTASSDTPDEGGPTATSVYETSTDAFSMETDQITNPHETGSSSIEFNKESTPPQMLDEISTEETVTTSTEDPLPKAASDHPSTSEPPPPPPPQSTRLVSGSNNTDRTTRTVLEDAVPVEKDGAKRWISIPGAIVFCVCVCVCVVAIFYFCFVSKKQTNGKMQNTDYREVSQANPQPLVNTGLYPLLPPIGSEPIKEELKN